MSKNFETSQSASRTKWQLKPQSTAPLEGWDGAALEVGMRYFNIETGYEYYYDGTQWVLVEPSNAILY